MSKYTWVLDFGLGGIDKDGNYTTKGKKQYTFVSEKKTLFTIYEGVVNRAIGYKLEQKLKDAKIECAVVSHPYKDTSLSGRVVSANNIYHKSSKRAIFVSLHSNAASNSIKGKGSKAQGYEIFTSVGQTESDKVAQSFLETYAEYFDHKLKPRYDKVDGDWDKEAQFYVLKKTHGPAILIENLFYDNIDEALVLQSEEGQEEIASCLFKCIQNYEKTANNSFNSEIN